MPRRHDPRDVRGAGGRSRRAPDAARRGRDARGSSPGAQSTGNVAYGIHSVRVLLQRDRKSVV